ncbi:MAG TPA: phosphatase PAP2 family protein [Methylomirabilota bacterium]|nr:phosphatase PAP2 family protein [Methylomirabilota bacterium]
MTRARVVHPRSVLMVAGACFTALATAIVLWGAFPADVFVRESLLNIAGPTVVSIFRVFNMGGDWRGLLPGTLLLFVLFPRARERWWLWIVLMLSAPICEWSLKQVFMRPRPENLSFSFPSGHSTAAAAFFGAVIYLSGSYPQPWRRAVRIFAAVMIVLVGLARVILRAHWPSDVVGGFALGLALASVASLLAASTPDPQDRAG